MYMRGVSDWNLMITKKEEQNFYMVIKRINKIDTPFIIRGKTLIDRGYYIVEFTPLDCCYNVRVFLDKEANVIGYYFDISRGNGVEDNIPYYDDLYLDIIFSPDGISSIRVEDEDELSEALSNGTITNEEYVLAHNTSENLIEKIKNGQNMFVNIDKRALIKEFF